MDKILRFLKPNIDFVETFFCKFWMHIAYGEKQYIFRNFAKSTNACVF